MTRTAQTAAEKFAEQESARIEFEKARAERNRREDAERASRQHFAMMGGDA